MATTCATIYARARAFSPRAPLVIPDRQEVLARIQADQQALFTSIAGLTRDRFKTTAALTSSVSASARTFTLSAVTPPVERVLLLTLSDGREVSQVDELDTDAELAPRYFVRGETLVEVSNDWNTASGAAVTGTLTYVYGATAIDTTGAMTQTVTVPDAWCDLLVLPLGMYLHSKDPQPNPAEHERMAQMLAERQQAFLGYLTNYGGIESRRFDVPRPVDGNKK